MKSFDDIYNQLNDSQREAVDHIWGPLLVIAGPGTGKTQLLSARVANILKKTDTLPQNILCLTFTESGAHAMRERLTGMIGSDAYDVQINTYHAFGSDIINSYPEFFESISQNREEDSRYERPIDDLAQLQLVLSLIDALPFDSPLINARYHPKDVVSTISEAKRQLMTPDKLRDVATDNLATCDEISPAVEKHYGGIARMPKADKAIELFTKLHQTLAKSERSLAQKAADELSIALDQAAADNTTKPLTAWKNDWLHRDDQATWQFTDRFTHERLRAFADLFANYQAGLRRDGLYDYDDMIIAAIEAIENKPELRANLQERYQFLLLDEFQDTNAAQFRLVQLIADHPVHEGQPNLMAVGDDDQAIFAFQGADVSNMKKLHDAFDSVAVINLSENYRSHHDIIEVAHNIAGQIDTRLHHQFDNVSKTLTAASDNLPKHAHIQRHIFASRASEYDWIARHISQQIADGEDAGDIAVLAPRHKFLEELVPFLIKYQVPVSYEKRENILETPIISSIVLIAKLLLALHRQDHHQASELMPIVLSLDIWQLPVESIWRINWQHAKYDETRSWAEIALEHADTKQLVQLLLALAGNVGTQPLEYSLDAITGVSEVAIDSEKTVTMPLKDYYFSDEVQRERTVAYYEALSHLSVLRSKLRDHQRDEAEPLTLADFISFYDMHIAADQPIINSHPIAQHDNAVQLMTAYKAKGLEFTSVYLPSLHDNIWGKSARSNTNRLSLPRNLEHLRYAGTSEDERKRLLFVAVTRAKHNLFLSSHTTTDSGKTNEAVKYLIENLADDDSYHSDVLPSQHHNVHRHETDVDTMQAAIQTLWEQRHLTINAEMKHLLKDRLQRYQMSPTHLNTFIDTEYGGPQQFLLGTLLRFPQAPGEEGEYGNAIHATLEQLQRLVNQGESLASIDVDALFERQLKRRYLSTDRIDYYLAKGRRALHAYLASRTDMFQSPADVEVDYRKEGVIIDSAHLSGKIDRIEVDKKEKTVHIADYKTGKPYQKWASKTTLHKYEQQLYFYKLLVEGSHRYLGYTVASARIEFIEPLASGSVAPPLYVAFDEQKQRELKQLIANVYQRITSLDLPIVTDYPANIGGIKKFEKYLREK